MKHILTENSSPPCRRQVRWSFIDHKTFLELRVDTALTRICFPIMPYLIFLNLFRFETQHVISWYDLSRRLITTYHLSTGTKPHQHSSKPSYKQHVRRQITLHDVSRGDLSFIIQTFSVIWAVLFLMKRSRGRWTTEWQWSFSSIQWWTDIIAPSANKLQEEMSSSSLSLPHSHFLMNESSFSHEWVAAFLIFFLSFFGLLYFHVLLLLYLFILSLPDLPSLLLLLFLHSVYIYIRWTSSGCRKTN